MNYKKLAEAAHVSVSTVSKAFSGSGEINPKTREEVFEAARKYGCFDKYYKNKFSKKVIAVLCPEFCSSHYGAYAEYAQKIISAKNDVAIFSSANFDTELEKYLLDYYALYAKVDGILIIDNASGIKEKYSVPVAVIGKNELYNSVNVSTYAGIEKAISYLIDCGHKNIGFIGERLTASKRKGFECIMEKEGFSNIKENIIISDKRFESAGCECAEKFLSLDKRPTAVIAAYDNIAIGFINTLKRNRVSVPEDVSVIGMDDIFEAAHLEFPLTSVNFRIPEAVNTALDMIYRRIEHPTIEETEHKEIFAHLVKRATVKKLHTEKTDGSDA